MKKDSLIVLSGGMDSVTMLHEYAGRIALAVTFDYGSNHNAREIECARRHCRDLDIEHIVIPLAFMGQYFSSSLLSGADAIPEGRYDAANMASTVVPFRNGIMLAIAAGLADSRSLPYVMLANHSGDHTIYPDCRPAFIAAMDAAIAAGTEPTGDAAADPGVASEHAPAAVHLLCPYTDIDKAEIARHGAALGLDYSTTYSCYKGGEHHCGRCGTCIERREALAQAHIPDPTIYDA